MKKRLLFWTPPALALGLVVAAFVVPPMWERHRLKEALRDASPAVRAEALWRLPREGDEALVMEALHDEDPDVRFVAVERLPFGKRVEVARELVPLLKDDCAYVRREAAWRLGGIGLNAWPVLEEALRDENPRTRAGAALALSDVHWHKGDWPSNHSEAILPILHKLLSDEDSEVRTNAELAIKHITR